MATTSADPAILPDGGVAANGLTTDAAGDSYRRHLRAGNKSPNTIKTYLVALADFNRYLKAQGMPTLLRGIRREHVESYVVALQESGKRPATVSLAFRSLQPFFKWAVSEEEITSSDLDRGPAAPPAPSELHSGFALRSAPGPGSGSRWSSWSPVSTGAARAIT